MRRIDTPGVIDPALALVLAFCAVVSTARQATMPGPWTELLVAGWVGTVALRTSRTMLATVLASGGAIGYAALGAESTPLWSFIALLLLGFAIGAELTGARTYLAAGILLAGVYVLQVTTLGGSGSVGDVYVSPLVLVGAPVAGGTLLRRSRERTAELHRLSRELASEREHHAHEAVEAERRRIARELHDVISHSVSSMVVQAGAAAQDCADEKLADQLHTIRQTGREALAELRRQLGMLRDEDTARTPVLPGLAQLPAIVAAFNAAYQVEGTPVPLAAGVELTICRIVEEALENVRRHAVGSTAVVLLCYRPGRIEVSVTNTEGRSRPDKRPAPGTGYGLVGARERVQLYDGEWHAGPDGVGWRVHVGLPLTEVTVP